MMNPIELAAVIAIGVFAALVLFWGYIELRDWIGRLKTNRMIARWRTKTFGERKP